LTAESVLLAQSVFDTGQVWIESINDQLLRIDTPAVETPVVEAPVVEAPVVEAPVAETPIAEPPSESEPLSEPVFTETSEPVVTGSATNPPASTAAESVPETVNVWGGAAWEVDAFDFPEQVAELFFGDQFFRSIARHMRESVDAGLGSVLVTSLESGNGRSTVAIGTALAAAATGLRVALVDVDIDAPDLSEQLRLETTVDWISALRNGQSLEQAAIASLEDGVTFLPLVDSFDRKTPITSLELDQLRDQITAGFDLVVFDGSPVKSWTSLHLARGVDSSLIVRDVRSASQQDVNAAAELLRRHGVRGIGVIENFCSGR
jgi:Mrp family chromosome partitioning ATPase